MAVSRAFHLPGAHSSVAAHFGREYRPARVRLTARERSLHYRPLRGILIAMPISIALWALLVEAGVYTWSVFWP